MAIIDKITEDAERLPASLQRKVLDFVQYFLSRYPSASSERSDRQLSRAFLAAEMFRLDVEEGAARVEYTVADLQERFR